MREFRLGQLVADATFYEIGGNRAWMDQHAWDTWEADPANCSASRRVEGDLLELDERNSFRLVGSDATRRRLTIPPAAGHA